VALIFGLLIGIGKLLLQWLHGGISIAIAACGSGSACRQQT